MRRKLSKKPPGRREAATACVVSVLRHRIIADGRAPSLNARGAGFQGSSDEERCPDCGSHSRSGEAWSRRPRTVPAPARVARRAPPSEPGATELTSLL